MERTWIERHRLNLLMMLLLLLLAGWTASTPNFQWRRQLITLKVRGLLPRASWSDLLFRRNPQERLPEIPWEPPYLLRVKQRGEEPCPALWETPMGNLWGRESDRLIVGTVLGEQFYLKIYEHESVAIQAGDVVFDVGSHLGAFTRFALQRNAGLIVAFEPDPTNIACYKRTFQQEIVDGRVILVEAALWEASGTLDFTTGAHSAAGYVSGTGLVHPEVKGSIPTKVPATTIDETVARLNLDRLDFIKMDIEGSERHALRGGRQSLARFGPRLAICIYHRQDDRVAVPQEVFAARSAYQMITTQQVAFFH